QQERNSIREQITPQPLKEIRIELLKSSSSTTNSDYTDEGMTADGQSSVENTNEARNDGDENLLTPDRVSAAKTLNAEIRTGVPNLSKLIDVLRKSKLKESEIMEIVSQVEGNDNTLKSPKVDFTSAGQNIPLKKQKNRERIAKATRELQNNIEPQEKAAQAHLAYFRQLPDLAASETTTIPVKIHFTGTQQLPPLTLMEFATKDPLQREVSPIPIGKTPYATPSPTLGTLSQGQYTTQPHYV
ncbi:hypothetical protein Angca_000587, partial [Angiostrongylus cantonensis]